MQPALLTGSGASLCLCSGRARAGFGRGQDAGASTPSEVSQARASSADVHWWARQP